jgi:hypothetical protein
VSLLVIYVFEVFNDFTKKWTRSRNILRGFVIASRNDVVNRDRYDGHRMDIYGCVINT